MKATPALLQNRVVYHISYGKGTVKEVILRPDGNGVLLKIDFSGEEKKFRYPDAFEKHLSPADKELLPVITQDLEEAKHTAQQKAADLSQAQAAGSLDTMAKQPASVSKTLRNMQRPTTTETPVQKRSVSRVPANMAFKCNYNDGGKDDTRIGFHGVCSDLMIHNNVVLEKREWCSHEDCPCCQYHSGLLSRKQLESKMCENWDNTCYEGQMLLNWKALAGACNSGPRKGERFKVRGARKDGLAVLTTRLPGQKEEARRIFAVFLIDKIDEGDEDTTGSVRSTSQYRLSFSEKESEKLLYWKYHANKNNPSKPAWGSGLFRYLSDEEAVQILRDATIVKKGTADETSSKEFLNYYCLVNRVNVADVPEPYGALTR